MGDAAKKRRDAMLATRRALEKKLTQAVLDGTAETYVSPGGARASEFVIDRTAPRGQRIMGRLGRARRPR